MVALISNAFKVGGGPNRLLRAFLWTLAAASSVSSFRALLVGYPAFADVEIPLRAAQRWLAGGQPYLASSFEAGAGFDLPFLYPPLALPFLAPLTLLPRELVWVAWVGACAGAALWLLRRLGAPPLIGPLLLLWPPFAEGIIGGNIQVLLVAGFALVFFAPSVHPWRVRSRDPRASSRPLLADGVPGVATVTLKVSQPHAWVALLRRRPAAALAGLGAVLAIAIATLPLVGLDLWREWVSQLQRAADPAWVLGGASLGARLPLAVGLALAAITAALCLVAPVARLGAWTGILAVVGGPSLRMFGVLYALPAMLVVRREASLLAAAAIATYTWDGLWLGILLVLVVLALSERYPALREPDVP